MQVRATAMRLVEHLPPPIPHYHRDHRDLQVSSSRVPGSLSAACGGPLATAAVIDKPSLELTDTVMFTAYLPTHSTYTGTFTAATATTATRVPSERLHKTFISPAHGLVYA